MIKKTLIILGISLLMQCGQKEDNKQQQNNLLAIAYYDNFERTQCATLGTTPNGGTYTLESSSKQSSYSSNPAMGAFGSTIYLAVVSSSNSFINSKIKKFSSGSYSDFVGSDTSGSLDGTGTAATFTNIKSIALDSSGNLYVLDNNKVRKVTSAGVVTTLQTYTSTPNRLALDSNNNGYVTLQDNTISKFDTTPTFTTYKSGLSFTPNYIAVDNSGNLFVTNSGNIYKIATDLSVSTFYSSSYTLYSLDSDSSGNIYLLSSQSTSNSRGTVLKFSSSGSSTILIQGSTLSNGKCSNNNSIFSSSTISINSSNEIYLFEQAKGSLYKYTN